MFWIRTFIYLITATVFCFFQLERTIAGAEDTVTPHLRVNQIGYLTDDAKVGIAFAEEPLDGTFQVIEADSKKQVFSGSLVAATAKAWGKFPHCYELDFTAVKKSGKYILKLDPSGAESRPFAIGNDAYKNYQDDLLVFMRQQRCGYNPFLDMVCHKRDGRTAYGPLPAESFVDASGGWHDAGDQLKYLITSSNATARMLLAYELDPQKFGDRVDDMGRPIPNGIADVLDEAKWGLDWLHKLHPHPTHLYHQVADDRDHTGWKYPDKDDSDYGWGPNSYRVVYFADGKPQGLNKHKSEATGVANLAGRSAAAMAIAARIWRNDLNDPVFADKCLVAAKELYQLGKDKEGYQQGNSFKAPYRYMENTWADDMEWGAAELFKTTGDKAYLADAQKYAEQIAATSWMPHEKAGHYEFYPFMNVGHFALYPHVDATMQKKLAEYYRAGIEACVARGKKNSYQIGVPFIWCSNNLVSALITQILLYEKMTGDMQYHDFMLAQRDWLLGRNPWGTSMFTGIPRDGEYPEDVHTCIWYLTKKMVPGGIVDGPVYTSVYENLLGLHLTQDDEFADFQNEHVVYHDDIGDYSTNEPTMDGTADAITLLTHFGDVDLTSPALKKIQTTKKPVSSDKLTIIEDGIVRGPKDQKQLALIFTGGDHGEGTELILDTLKEKKVPGSFFVTGGYTAKAEHASLLRRMVAERHFLGPHSHGHLLYAPWENRQTSLVSEQEFKDDLQRNLNDLAKFGADRKGPIYFVPPYEWYNKQHAAWAKDLGCVLVNFTSGSGSNRDWAPEDHASFKPSQEILADILSYEAKEPDGLNGHLLLLHLGSLRKDKMPPNLGMLIDELRDRGYEFVSLDQLLNQ
jgi:peptidoglycan/xylan/chitin deacetylase (PgdA/CDA1 family)